MRMLFVLLALYISGCGLLGSQGDVSKKAVEAYREFKKKATLVDEVASRCEDIVQECKLNSDRTCKKLTKCSVIYSKISQLRTAIELMIVRVVDLVQLGDKSRAQTILDDVVRLLKVFSSEAESVLNQDSEVEKKDPV